MNNDETYLQVRTSTALSLAEDVTIVLVYQTSTTVSIYSYVSGDYKYDDRVIVRGER